MARTMRYKYNKYLDQNGNPNVSVGIFRKTVITPKKLDNLRFNPEIREFAEFVAVMNTEEAKPKEVWKLSHSHPEYKKMRAGIKK